MSETISVALLGLGRIGSQFAAPVGGERTLLEVGSVQGFRFDADLIGRVLDRRRLDVLQGLARIERRTGIVRARERDFELDHHLIHELVYEGLSTALRSESSRRSRR